MEKNVPMMNETKSPIAKLANKSVNIASDENTDIIETESVFSGSNGRFNSYTFNALVEVVERLEEDVFDQQNEIRYLRTKHAEDIERKTNSISLLTKSLDELVLNKTEKTVATTS